MIKSFARMFLTVFFHFSLFIFCFAWETEKLLDSGSYKLDRDWALTGKTEENVHGKECSPGYHRLRYELTYNAEKDIFGNEHGGVSWYRWESEDTRDGRIRVRSWADGLSWVKYYWKIYEKDITPSAEFDLTSPPNNFHTSDSLPTFSWQPSNDDGSGLLKYQLYIDELLNRDDISPTTTSATPTFSLPEGLHSWYIVAVDKAGNTQKSISTWQIKVDVTQPTLVLVSHNEGSTQYTTDSIVISGTASDNAGLATDGSGMQYRIVSKNKDSGWINSGDTTPESWSITLDHTKLYPHDGENKVYFRAKDKTGNLIC